MIIIDGNTTTIKFSPVGCSEDRGRIWVRSINYPVTGLGFIVFDHCRAIGEPLRGDTSHCDVIIPIKYIAELNLLITNLTEAKSVLEQEDTVNFCYLKYLLIFHNIKSINVVLKMLENLKKHIPESYVWTKVLFYLSSVS